jgi:phosphoglucomutase
MNNLTVQQTTQGLAKYILQQDPEARHKGVVLGHDSRHHSLEFAQTAASVFANEGIKVLRYPYGRDSIFLCEC